MIGLRDHKRDSMVSMNDSSSSSFASKNAKFVNVEKILSKYTANQKQDHNK